MMKEFVKSRTKEWKQCTINVILPDLQQHLCCTGSVEVQSKRKDDLMDVQVILGCGVSSRADKILPTQCSGCMR